MASRTLRKLRRKYRTHYAARRAWEAIRQQRYSHVQLLSHFPRCLELLRAATSAFDLPAVPPERHLNVILRRYGPGDWLGRHVDDVAMFAEPVLSTVLQAGGPGDGLLFTLPPTEAGLAAARADALAAGADLAEQTKLVAAPFRVPEAPGTAICLEREARYLYGHEVAGVSRPRVSMTWRWLRADYAGELEEVEEWLLGGGRNG